MARKLFALGALVLLVTMSVMALQVALSPADTLVGAANSTEACDAQEREMLSPPHSTSSSTSTRDRENIQCNFILPRTACATICAKNDTFLATVGLFRNNEPIRTQVSWEVTIQTATAARAIVSSYTLPIERAFYNVMTQNWELTLRVGSGIDVDLYNLTAVAHLGDGAIVGDLEAHALKIVERYERDFSFVHLTDVHIDYPGAASTFEQIINEINIIDPEFVMVTGDLVGVGWGGDIHAQLQMYLDYIEKLNVPVMTCIGNHEVQFNSNVEGTAQMYENTIGPLQWSFSYGAFRGIMLDTTSGYWNLTEQDLRTEGELDAEELAWLEAELNRTGGGGGGGGGTTVPTELTVLGYHHALSSIKHGGRDELVDIVRAHNDTVKLCLAGHHHEDGVTSRNDTWYVKTVSASAYSQTDYNGYRRVKVEDMTIAEFTYNNSQNASIPYNNLRLVYDGPNNGSATALSATIYNALNATFEDATISFVVPRVDEGFEYLFDGFSAENGAEVVRLRRSDQFHEYLVRLTLRARSVTNIGIRREGVADLDISHAEFVPEVYEALPGDAVQIALRVVNNGEVTVEDAVISLTIDNGSHIATQTTTLRPYNSDVVIFNWTATAGPHLFFFTIDPYDSVEEFDESNNDLSLYLSVGDFDHGLRLTAPVKSQEMHRNETVNFFITIENPGNVEDTYLLQDMAPLQGITVTLPGSYRLEPGERDTIRVTVTSSASTSYGAFKLTINYSSASDSSVYRSIALTAAVVAGDDNEPPVGMISVPPRIHVGDLAYFDASSSHDPDDDPLAFTWYFGDNTTIAGADDIVTHRYTTTGRFTVIVNVSDGRRWDMAAASVNVENKKPVAQIISPEPNTQVHAGTPVQFNGSISYDADGDPLIYFWDFGDGTHSNAPTLSHVYNQTGRFTATLTVSDHHEYAVVYRVVNVTNTPPEPDIDSNSSVRVGEVLTFDATRSTDMEGDPLTFYWDLGDNSTTMGATVQHTYRRAGNFTVELRVSDGFDTATARKIIMIKARQDREDEDTDDEEVPVKRADELFTFAVFLLIVLSMILLVSFPILLVDHARSAHDEGKIADEERGDKWGEKRGDEDEWAQEGETDRYAPWSDAAVYEQPPMGMGSPPQPMFSGAVPAAGVGPRDAPLTPAQQRSVYEYQRQYDQTVYYMQMLHGHPGREKIVHKRKQKQVRAHGRGAEHGPDYGPDHGHGHREEKVARLQRTKEGTGEDGPNEAERELESEVRDDSEKSDDGNARKPEETATSPSSSPSPSKGEENEETESQSVRHLRGR